MIGKIATLATDTSTHRSTLQVGWACAGGSCSSLLGSVDASRVGGWLHAARHAHCSSDASCDAADTVQFSAVHIDCIVQ